MRKIIFGLSRSTTGSSRMDLVQCQQPESRHAGCRAGPVQENPPSSSHQRDCHRTQCHSITGSSEGKSCPWRETADPGPATHLWIWCVWCISCSGSEAFGGCGLSASLYRWEWESGPSWSPDTESVLSEQGLSEWTLAGALPSTPQPHLTLSMGPQWLVKCVWIKHIKSILCYSTSNMADITQMFQHKFG